MKLSFDTDTAGDFSVAILDKTSNDQMADAILRAFTARIRQDIPKRTREVKSYVKTLLNAPIELFFDPCYELHDDVFVCNFTFE